MIRYWLIGTALGAVGGVAFTLYYSPSRVERRWRARSSISTNAIH